MLVFGVHQRLDCGIFLVEPLHSEGSVSSGNRIGRHEHAHLPSRLQKGSRVSRSYERDCVCSVTSRAVSVLACSHVQSCMLTHLHGFLPLQPFRIIEQARVELVCQALAQQVDVLADKDQFLTAISPATVKVGSDLLSNATKRRDMNTSGRKHRA